jgi:serine/threonine protein phosphatase PrpC
MNAQLNWYSASHSDVGCVRKVNEDACLDRPDAGVWAVADGMGGHQSGDLASGMIVNALRDVPAPERLSELVDLVDDRIIEVNRRLREEAASRGADQMIGSTVVALLARGRHGVCLWAGDSRLYRLRDGVMQQLSRDHSQVEEMIALGEVLREDAESHPFANVITRAVGASDELIVDVDLLELRPGDVYLLCSDGLFKELRESEIAVMLGQGGPETCTRNLISLALERGSRDNVTVVVVQISAT